MSKVIIITGASRGIGAATARLAAKQGYSVCINYKNQTLAAQSLVKEIQSLGNEAIAIAADVTNTAAVEHLFSETEQSLGPVTALVNNAGVVAPQSRFENTRMERIRHLFEVNVFGTMLCTQQAIKTMSTQHGGNGGAIVNVSSAASRLGSAGEYVDYAATKGAVDSLTTGLSKELAGEGIRVNAVRPAFIYTDMHADGGEPGRVDRIKSSLPMQRGGQPEEVAAAIMWLLSDEASYTTGTFIDMAGGL
mgnify:CR=1 FL=1